MGIALQRLLGQIVDLLEFDFPLDFERNTVLYPTEENHASATQFASHVRAYIQEEAKPGTILGPLNNKPMELHVSLFMTRDKPDSNTRRTIVNLMQVFHWSRPCNRPYDSRVGYKSSRVMGKSM